MSKKLKISLILLFSIIGILLFSTNAEATITAEIVKGETTSTMLDFLPTDIDLNMKEIEFDKAEKYVYNLLITEFSQNNIELREYDRMTSWPSGSTIMVAFPKGPSDAAGITTIKEIEVSLNMQGSSYTKKVNLHYTNSDDYNEKDKEYVDNLFKDEISFLKYMEIGQIEIYGNAFFNKMKTDVVNFTKKQINDDSIDIVYNGTLQAGGDSSFRMSGHANCSVFRNGVMYIPDVSIELDYQTALIIPDNIVTKEDCENYALKKVNSYLGNYNPGISKMELEEDGCYFKIYYSGDDEAYAKLVLMREAGVHVGDNIFADNLPVDVGIDRHEVEKNKKDVIVEKLKYGGYADILNSFELKLDGLDALLEPIKLTFTVGKEYDGKTVCVLHQKKDNTYEEFKDVKVEKGQVTITVSELSPFVIGLQTEKIEDEKNETVEHEKDDSPKTGVEYISVICTSLLTVISLLGIVVIKKTSK